MFMAPHYATPQSSLAIAPSKIWETSVMEPRHLYQMLLASKNLTTNGLAEKLGGAVEQSQLNRFETGKTKEPRRTTLQPVADFFGLPVEVFYSEDLAESVAQKMRDGLAPSEIMQVSSVSNLPVNYSEILSAPESQIKAVLIGQAKAKKPTQPWQPPTGTGWPEEERLWLTRFMRALHRLPPGSRAAALKEATALLLDHLPDPPTDEL